MKTTGIESQFEDIVAGLPDEAAAMQNAAGEVDAALPAGAELMIVVDRAQYPEQLGGVACIQSLDSGGADDVSSTGSVHY